MDSQPNSSGPRSGVPPGGGTSLVRPTVPFHPESSTEERSFLFINTQDDVSQTFGVGRQKKAFLSKLAHQRRKQESIERLKYTQSIKRIHGTAAEEDFMQGQTRQAMWSLAGFLGQGYVDPFDTSSVPMTDSMNMYFYHFRVQLAPTTIPLDGTREGIIWAQKSTSSPALLYIILFTAAGNKAVLESMHATVSPANLKSTQDSILLRVKAIRCLNQLLQNPATAAAESTILCVSIIIYCEALNGEFMASQAHMRGLNTLIGIVGGLEGLEHITLAKIYQGDIARAALHNSKPSFPLLPRFRSEVLNEAEMFHGGTGNYKYGHQILVPPALSSLGTRFYKASWYVELDLTMKNTICVCCRLLMHFEMATIQPKLIKPTDNDLYIILKHHLLSLDYPPQNNNLNEPLRRSLLIYTYLRVSHFGNFPAMRYMVDGLRHSLVPRLAYFYITAPDLLLWILFIGSIASQGYESHSWFIGYLREMAVHLQLEEWDEARSVFVEFFYTDQPGYTGGEDIWNEVLTPSYPYIAPRIAGREFLDTSNELRPNKM